jgi:hypothetical protein
MLHVAIYKELRYPSIFYYGTHQFFKILNFLKKYRFTDFEYLFDYAKFDQVEPFQPQLFHMNVAHLYRHLNYVRDTKKEDKNYQLTCQNTLENQDELVPKRSLKSYYQSVRSLRSGSGLGGVVESSAANNSNINNGKSFVPIQTILSAFMANNLNAPGGAAVAGSHILNQPELNNGVINVDCADGGRPLPLQGISAAAVVAEPPTARNGRFTIVPVVADAADKTNCLLITTIAAEERKDPNKKRMLFHKRSAVANASLNYKNSGMGVSGCGGTNRRVHGLREECSHHHIRANSLPPIFSASQLELEESESAAATTAAPPLSHRFHHNIGVLSAADLAVAETNDRASFFIGSD